MGLAETVKKKWESMTFNEQLAYYEMEIKNLRRQLKENHADIAYCRKHRALLRDSMRDLERLLGY